MSDRMPLKGNCERLRNRGSTSDAVARRCVLGSCFPF